jgi:hypothetical protein
MITFPYAKSFSNASLLFSAQRNLELCKKSSSVKFITKNVAYHSDDYVVRLPQRWLWGVLSSGA